MLLVAEQEITRFPARSALFRQRTCGLVVVWVTRALGLLELSIQDLSLHLPESFHISKHEYQGFQPTIPSGLGAIYKV
jgi:hypothetical protein